jgi:hypothetical protein
MIERRRPPLGVPLHLRRVLNPQLLSHELQHHPRHIKGILQERPEPAHRHQLQGEPEPHVLAAPLPDQRPVLVIEEEHPLQINLRRRSREPPVRRRLIISQELHRHTPQSRTDPPVANPESPNRYRTRVPPDVIRIGTASDEKRCPPGSLT